MSEDFDTSWATFVKEVEGVANRPDNGYRAILLVGMRVRDDRLVLNAGASPPLLLAEAGGPLKPAQLHIWRNAMMASAAEALDRVVDSLIEAAQARERGALN